MRMRIISKDVLQVGETKSSAGRAYYACDSPTRYSPYASLTCFFCFGVMHHYSVVDVCLRLWCDASSA
jgi:hypothetical protein